jgi:hypothetical protein
MANPSKDVVWFTVRHVSSNEFQAELVFEAEAGAQTWRRRYKEADVSIVRVQGMPKNQLRFHHEAEPLPHWVKRGRRMGERKP